MIHYHGTPFSPAARIHELAGRSFCVSFAEPRQVQVCHEIGEGVMLDNGAFSLWRSGRDVYWGEFASWVRPWLDYQTTWYVIPDLIGGDENDNDALIRWWFKENRDIYERGAPVWHMHESIERFRRLCHGYPRVCIGSSAQYANVGDDLWRRRMDEAMNVVCGNGPAPTWLHMLRGMSLAGDIYPFASVDSTNVAVNFKGSKSRATTPKDPARMAAEIDSRQSAPRWVVRDQLRLETAA